MLPEALAAIAAAGGTAVVQAAGTDAWTGLRQQVAQWFGRGNSQREHAELARLDRTAGELERAEPAEADHVRTRQQAAWQARIEAVLEDLNDTDRVQATTELRALLDQHSSQLGASAGNGGLAVGGNLGIRSENRSIAAGVIHGGAHISIPQMPDPSQG